jgi:hypothetical protein
LLTGDGHNFGTVTITDVATNLVSVDVDLWNSFTWAKTGFIGFAFNLASGFAGAILRSCLA